jgi:hypothetical protein
VGATGPRGPAGETGPTGPAGAANIVTRYGPDVSLPDGSASFSYAACLTGETVTGGGYDFPGGRPNGTSPTQYFVSADRPSIMQQGALGPVFPPPADGTAPTGWVTFVENDTGGTFDFRTYVMCASP